jgi:manganese transport protein
MTTLDHSVSLGEVHSSVQVPSGQKASVIKRLLAFGGPAYLISVGYIDPGNWATDLEGGSRFGYQLLWVLVMSNLMAVLLQSLSARLGIVTGRDLAQSCRDHYGKRVTFVLWILCEVAIAACDLAEVLGTAIALNLLFGLQLIYGVLLTALDVLLLLGLQRMGMRKLEALIMSLVLVVGGAFLIQMFFAKPDMMGIVGGIVPHLSSASLFVAIGILGATVMPHNLYLHSALVQTRTFESTTEGKREACKFNLIDSVIALNGALFINGAILVLAAAVFFKHGMVVTGIQQAHELLSPLVGNSFSSVLFAVALLASGQSSTVTGTLAGQVVMEGFVNLRIRPAVRRLLTRALAIIPAVLVIGIAGDDKSYYLLLLSQVILSMQLAFAIIPLVQFTSERRIMGEFANAMWVKALAWLTAAIVVGLNIKLLIDAETDALTSSGVMSTVGMIGLPILLALAIFLLYIAISPAMKKLSAKEPELTVFEAAKVRAQKFRRIGIAVERSQYDAAVIERALAVAGENASAEIVLIHVVTSAAARVFGTASSDTNTRLGEEYLAAMKQHIHDELPARVTVRIGFGEVTKEMVHIAREEQIDVLIMGAHGHRGIKDVLFGATISSVRHVLSIPILVVK